jgi:hypothetical protein
MKLASIGWTSRLAARRENLRPVSSVKRDRPRQIITFPGDAFMPLPLSLEEQNLLLTLAAPIDRSRQPEFMSAVTTKLEAQGPATVGPGAVHRAAREILSGFWSPPPDLRQGRLGHRGPRS